MSKYYSFLFPSHHGPVTVCSHDPRWQSTMLTSYSGPACLSCLPLIHLQQAVLCYQNMPCVFVLLLDFTFCSSFLECLTPAGEHLVIFLVQLKCQLPFHLCSLVSASFESRVYSFYWIAVIPRSAALTRTEVP